MNKQADGEYINKKDAMEFFKDDVYVVNELNNMPSVRLQRYCDRNICLSNEYNRIGCEECEVTKSQEPTDENLHREREQAYMQGYEDACKKYRQVSKTGHWILGICDNCGYDWGKDAPIASVPNFCPNCGTKMDYYYGNSPYSEERSEQNDK